MICDKVAYETAKDAATDLASLNKRKGQQFSVYKCNLCGKYHKSTVGKKILNKRIRPKEQVRPPKNPRNMPPRKAPPLATEKLLTKEQVRILKMLVEGKKYLANNG